MSSSSLARLLKEKLVRVCCGAGGVGKTTVSASLALGAAQAGLRVVVITIDPSRRLAETLGVSPNQDAPTELSADRLASVGVSPPGSLSAWMLDPALGCDHVVRTVSKSAADAEELMNNRLYKNIAQLVAGMQEYTAVEALHGFVVDDRYDLVVLDTPPSRNALRFLETPHRANGFLDPKIFNLFLPSPDGALQKAAGKVIRKILDLGLGEESRTELQQFLDLFMVILKHLNHNQEEMRNFFASSDVSFLLVTSPNQAAVEEAFYFEQKTRELNLPLGGYILNRSLIREQSLPTLSLNDMPSAPPGVAESAVNKMMDLAAQEDEIIQRHLALGRQLQERVGTSSQLSVLPRLRTDASDLEALVELSHILKGTQPISRHAEASRPSVPPSAAGMPTSQSWFPPKNQS